MRELTFLPGLELGELFFAQAVEPLLARRFPGLVYSAALLGSGSEVLGFDTPQSMDHDWGPRLQLFLAEADFTAQREAIDAVLSQELPASVAGIPTELAYANHSDGQPERQYAGPIRHSVTIHTPGAFFLDQISLDPVEGLCPADWLVIPEQRLLALTGGRVFHDGLGQLELRRQALRYYPHDLWLYLMAAQWRRIGQEEHFMGRCGQVGDELGSRLIAGRLVRDVMRLAFLQERRYAPYIKWFGTAFQQLRGAGALAPWLQRALEAADWQPRQQALCRAYQLAAQQHNALGLTPVVAPEISAFFDRPFQVLHADRFSEALRAAISDPQVLALPPYLGSVDQFSDSTDLLSNPPGLTRLKSYYEHGS
jgi:hypothetical protein